MTTMTDSKAADVLERMRMAWPLATDEGPALDHAAARLREPAGVGGEVVIACDCGANRDNRWPHHDECSVYTAAPPSAPVEVDAMPGLRRELSGIVHRDDAEMVSIEPNEAAAILRALAQQPAAVERTKWVCGFCTRHYHLPNPCGRYCCDAQAEFRAAQQPAAVDGAK